MSVLADIQRKVDTMHGARGRIETDLYAAKQHLAASQIMGELCDHVLEVLETSGGAARKQVQEEFGAITTAAMQDIFGGDAAAEVEFTATARGYQARILTHGNGFRGDPLRTDGGSACKILSVALRAALLHRLEDRPNVLILDEPFSGVDAEHIVDTAAWLRTLSEALGLQVIMINHEWPEVWSQHAHRIIDLTGEEPEYIDEQARDAGRPEA
jgi:ATPase subunit of ABC transporter with duplicated ATPase domains